MKKHLNLAILLLLPLIFLVFGLSFQRAKYSNDPEYIYLINALSIDKLRPVGHIDNPGTTVMEIGAALLKVVHKISPVNESDLLADVIKNSDWYVEVFSTFFIILIAVTLYWLGFIVVKKTHNLWAGLIFQITPFFSITILEQAWTKVSPEPLLIFTSLFLSGMLLIYYFDENRNHHLYFLLFAMISGFGLATKATFLPVAIIPFLLLPGFLRKAGYLLFMILFFVIFTFPAWPEYSNMYDWYVNLATHKGVYGSGDEGFIDATSFFVSIGKILRNNIHFSILLFVSGLTLLYFSLSAKVRNHTKSLSFKILFALVMTNIFGILLVAKHYHANHYLVPELALGGLSIFFIIEDFKDLISNLNINKFMMPVIVGFLVVYLPVNNIPTLKYFNRGYKTANEEYETTMRLIDEKYSDYKRIYFYPTSLNQQSALMFGNMYSKKKNLDEISAVFPETTFYDHPSKLFNFWKGEASLDDIIKSYGKKLLLVGGPLSDEMMDANQKAMQITGSGFPLKPVYQGRVQALYVFDTTAYQLLLCQREANSFVIDLDMETRGDFPDYISHGTHQFLIYNTRSKEQSRSGSFSIKLDKNQQYSLGYIFENTKAGETYKISIWRFSAGNEGFVAVTSTPDAFYYRQNNETTITDEKGWKKIQLIFTVPENLNNNQLKMYVWNSGSSEMYFDDLTIEKN